VGIVLVLLAFCAGAVYTIVRVVRGLPIAQWSAWRVLRVVAFAAAPWGVLWLAFHGQYGNHLQININGLGSALVWLVLVILMLALFVFVPLGAVVVAVAWGRARLRSRPVA